ncbi:MAG: hypothetical protein GEU78_03935 [Actinobacteria bacterium]|nr:hypothetical protein [Actinomycetota bacterium]
MRRIMVTCVLVPALLLAACGGGEETGSVGGGACRERIEGSPFTQPVAQDAKAYGLVVNSDLSVGSNRVLVGVLDDSDAPIGSPEMDVSMELFDICSSTEDPVASTDTEFIWTIEPVQGVFVGGAEFDRAGKYGAEISIEGDGIDETAFASFDVKAEPSTPAIGAPAPASDSKTADDVKDLELLTTDPKPDPAFYELSVADAVAAGEPFVLVFSTPKFCTSAVCGPTLDIVKGVAPDHPGVNFLHVEVYELPADVNNLQTVQAVQEWGLPSEPWVFVVDADGKVAGKFEGGVGAGELNAALQGL